MNKEEIEHIQEIKKMLKFTTEGTSLKIDNNFNEIVDKIKNQFIKEKDLAIAQYIINKQQKELEQKEFILDEVTKFANKIATENAEKYNSENQKEVDFSEWNLALEILNIIEGENHE